MSAPNDDSRETALFEQALAQPTPEAREAFLRQACGDDAAMLVRLRGLLEVHDRSGHFLEPSSSDATEGDTVLVTATESAGMRIGHYKLLQRLGEGGMGTVWMAEQTEPIRRMVAVKIIKAGMDSAQILARFEAERQALALMDHPNIAKILDAGVTGPHPQPLSHPMGEGGRRPGEGAGGEGSPHVPAGRPYFVMELVKGIPLTKFCDEQRLSIAERLELFMPVCHAIQHAHQKGIIHRDIKPSNVLVALYDGRPVPKVIDFGIAKATGQRLTERTLFTEFGAVIGTLEYMSPEQAEMNQLDIDTRSDIYSLGVLLYELLTGTTPLTRETVKQAAFAEVLRRIREEEPPRPSTRLSQTADRLASLSAQRKLEPKQLTNALRGDLDWIVMKALEKERNRRYETANGFALDLQRFLTSEPVLARPPSAAYRFQKMVRRNKVAFVGAGLVILSLVLGLGATTILFFKEQAARHDTDVARSEVVQQKSEVDRKNAEYRTMLAEAARSDRLIAEENLRLGRQPAAFAYLARACEYDPSSTFAAEKVIAVLNDWHYSLPTTFLVGHSNAIRSAQFSPDGTHIVTVSDDNTARVWDATTGKTRAMFSGVARGKFSAQFSPDGTHIVTALNDKTARIWDIATGKVVITVAGHTSWVRSAQFSPDGTRIVTASDDMTARVWDAATGKALATLSEDEGWMDNAQFSPDNSRIVTASGSNKTVRAINTVRVWDAITGKALFVLAGYGGEVSSAQFSPDSTRIVTPRGPNKTALVWDATTGKVLVTLAGHEDLVNSAQFGPDGKRIVTASGDKTARVWDAATGKALVTLAGHEKLVKQVQFSQDGTRIVTVSDDATARVWDAATSKTLAILAGHEESALSARVTMLNAQFSPDGTRAITTSFDKPARVWDLATGNAPLLLTGHEGWVNSVQFSPDSTRIITPLGPNKTARVWDATAGKVLVTLAGHKGLVNGAQFSPDGTRIVTASDDKTARVWGATTGQALVTLAGHEGRVWKAEFSPDGRRVVTASEDKTSRVWDAATGKALATLAGHENDVWRAKFSPDGTRIVTVVRRAADGSNYETARVWDAATGKALATLTGHEGEVARSSPSPDGRLIVTTPDSRIARVKEAATGKTLAALAGHQEPVVSAQFNQDGTRILTASLDQTARIWDATAGKSLATLVGHEGPLLTAQFSPDGSRIATTSWDRTVLVWSVLPPTAGPPPAWFPDFLRYMAQMRLNPDGELETLKPADWLALRERLRGVLRASADTPYLRILSKYVHW